MQQKDWTFNQQQLATAGYTTINNVFKTAQISDITTEI
jgi:hypothetical protein